MSGQLTVSEQIIAAIRRIMRAADLYSRRLFAQHGITEPQFIALRESERLERPSISLLARSIHLSQGTETGIVDRLERTGLVTRMRDGKDRRAVYVIVTEKGRRLLQNMQPLLQDRLDAELSLLKQWEQTSILATLQRIGEMMNAETLDASPMLVTGPVDHQPGEPSPNPPVDAAD
jgi:DNA-binding MarR family transcriptional regulator